MMREIKFRVWNKNKQRYSRQDEQSFLVENNDNESYNVASVSFDYELEQFTGLHDKNGQKIYEGDIVKLHVVILSPDDKVGFIEYSPKFGYCINFGKAIARQEYWAANDKHTIEVIGNIHENKELLEKKQ